MNSQRLRKLGTALFAVTALAFVTLPFWISEVLALLARVAEARTVGHLPFPALLFQILINLPLLIMVSLWMGFLIAWFISRRARSAHSPQNADHLAKMRAGVLVLAAAVALAVTVVVELGYLDLIGGAAIGSNLDESEHALLHFYLFIEVPQFFLVLLWTPFLPVAWLPPPNSLVTNRRLYLLIGFLLLVVTGLVWIGYPDWISGVGIVSANSKQIPADAFLALDAVPVLFVACVWLFFFWFLGSSLGRSRHALGPA